jgi:hypothetical protein
LGQQAFELPVFLGKALLVLGGVAEDLLQAEHFVLESLDVELFALSVSPLGLPV